MNKREGNKRKMKKKKNENRNNAKEKDLEVFIKMNKRLFNM